MTRLTLILAHVAAISTIAAPAQTVSAFYPAAANFAGTYMLANLPACSADTINAHAYVPDLGGGAGIVYCAGGAWNRLGLGRPAVNATNGPVTLRRLESAPIQVLTGQPLSVAIDAAGLVDGDTFYVRKSGLLVGTLGMSLNTGGTIIPLLSNTTVVVSYSSACGCLQQVQ